MASLAWGIAERRVRRMTERARSPADALFADDEFDDWLADSRRPLEPWLFTNCDRPFRPELAW